MKFFFKCVAFYLILWAGIAISDQLWFEPDHTLSASILFGFTAGLVVTVIYGWIDEVYIRHHHSI